MKCPNCGCIADFISQEGVVKIMRCSFCGNEFAVRVHYIENSVSSMVDVFDAVVKVGLGENSLKLKLKVMNVFRGFSNFYQADLDNQIEQGVNFWKLGVYDEQEIIEIKRRASNFGLEVDFIPCNDVLA